MGISRKDFINHNMDALVFAKMKMVRYGSKLFWSFELQDKSTQTLTHEEFQYFLDLQIKRHRNSHYKRNSKAYLDYLSSKR